MKHINLSPIQQEVADYKYGSLLVKASAGSGKTRVLTERIKNLISLTKRRILAITFTNKACEEIKERLSDIEDINNHLLVSTFHGFCEYVLRNHGTAIGYDEMPQIFSESSDRLKLVELAILETPILKKLFDDKEPKGKTSFKHEALDIISEIKRGVILDDELKDIVDDEIFLLYNKYQEILFSQNGIDFDDLLLITYRLFINFPKITSLYQRNFEFVCVDEAQDMNKAQYMLLKAFAGNEHKNIMLVGDPKQSIYGFNGGDSQFMNDLFVEDFSPQIFTLNENFRNSEAVLEIANKIMPDSSELKNAAKKGICDIIECKDVKSEQDWILGKIQDLISLGHHEEIEGDIVYDKIAILARNKYILAPIEESFKENKIPFYYKTSNNDTVFESNSMNLFYLALQVKINPRDTLHYEQLLRLLKIKNLRTLEELVHSVTDELKKQLINTVFKLELDGSNFVNLISKLDKGIKAYSDIDDNEKALLCSDLGSLLRHWYNYAKKSENYSLSSFRNAIALGQTSQNQQEDGIALSTVHTMKGQEYDIVFLIGLDDATFPDYRAIEKGNNSIEMQQEKNNLYVAITRAKRFLYITYPTSRIMPWGDTKKRIISRFLRDI